jgi:hypothetical protein
MIEQNLLNTNEKWYSVFLKKLPTKHGLDRWWMNAQAKKKHAMH